MTNAEENRNWDKDFPSESRTDRLRLYRNIIIFAVLIPGIVIALMYLGTAYIEINDPTIFITNIYRFLGFLIITLIVSLPLLNRVNSKYRKGELPYPNERKYKECRGTIKNQCKICKRHPISKKYHIENYHNKKNEKIKDYFVACGCLKCEKWEYYGE